MKHGNSNTKKKLSIKLDIIEDLFLLSVNQWVFISYNGTHLSRWRNFSYGKEKLTLYRNLTCNQKINKFFNFFLLRTSFVLSADCHHSYRRYRGRTDTVRYTHTNSWDKFRRETLIILLSCPRQVLSHCNITLCHICITHYYYYCYYYYYYQSYVYIFPNVVR